MLKAIYLPNKKKTQQKRIERLFCRGTIFEKRKLEREKTKNQQKKSINVRIKSNSPTSLANKILIDRYEKKHEFA